MAAGEPDVRRIVGVISSPPDEQAPLGAGVEEPPNRNGAFPRLDESQPARLLEVGVLREVEVGEVLFARARIPTTSSRSSPGP
jgi:hypothetical protein